MDFPQTALLFVFMAGEDDFIDSDTFGVDLFCQSGKLY